MRVYFKDWTGERKQTTKRGFAKKSDAQDWERAFKLQKEQRLDMNFEAFVNIYLNDIEPRLKRNSFLSKEHVIRKKLFLISRIRNYRTSDLPILCNGKMKL